MPDVVGKSHVGVLRLENNTHFPVFFHASVVAILFQDGRQLGLNKRQESRIVINFDSFPRS